MNRFAFATLVVVMCWNANANAQVFFNYGGLVPPGRYIAPGVVHPGVIPGYRTWNGAYYNYNYQPFGSFYNYRYYNYGYYNNPGFYRTYPYGSRYGYYGRGRRR